MTPDSPGAILARMAQLYDPSPRNRLAHQRPVLDILVRHHDGALMLDPNGVIIAAVEGRLRALKPLPDARSVISGEPSVLYCAQDYELPLSPHELDRLARHALSPREVQLVGNHLGEIFEIHDDFYDREGGAIDPVSLPEPKTGEWEVSSRYVAQHDARRGLWHVLDRTDGRRVGEKLTWDSLQDLAHIDIWEWCGDGDGKPASERLRLLSMDEIVDRLKGDGWS